MSLDEKNKTNQMATLIDSNAQMEKTSDMKVKLDRLSNLTKQMDSMEKLEQLRMQKAKILEYLRTSSNLPPTTTSVSEPKIVDEKAEIVDENQTQDGEQIEQSERLGWFKWLRNK